ncbi:hypothetical protein DIW83_10725 [Acinetobacter nosocomialis]|uniref:hypothetical protein n=1 Tax=Acinetobacter nosocomialis TaxID=106654 RepID=UPI0002FE6ABF|nr:hypothetical protein [Acinetobacter nosocomialis]AWL19465.1 hypothetical protein DIW83_10725 [Acinetobacter nosocomialis]
MSKFNKVLIGHQIEQFKLHCLKLWFVSDLAATYKNSDLFDYFIHDSGFVYWSKEQTRQLWDFWQSAQANKPLENYPTYSVIGLDLEVEEPHLILGDDYLMVSECFHTNDGYKAQEKLQQFKQAFPKAMITNNAIISLEYLGIKKKRLEKELGITNEGLLHD